MHMSSYKRSTSSIYIVHCIISLHAYAVCFQFLSSMEHLSKEHLSHNCFGSKRQHYIVQRVIADCYATISILRELQYHTKRLRQQGQGGIYCACNKPLKLIGTRKILYFVLQKQY